MKVRAGIRSFPRQQARLALLSTHTTCTCASTRNSCACAFVAATGTILVRRSGLHRSQPRRRVNSNVSRRASNDFRRVQPQTITRHQLKAIDGPEPTAFQCGNRSHCCAECTGAAIESNVCRRRAIGFRRAQSQRTPHTKPSPYRCPLDPQRFMVETGLTARNARAQQSTPSLSLRRAHCFRRTHNHFTRNLHPIDAPWTHRVSLWKQVLLRGMYGRSNQLQVSLCVGPLVCVEPSRSARTRNLHPIDGPLDLRRFNVGTGFTARNVRVQQSTPNSCASGPLFS